MLTSGYLVYRCAPKVFRLYLERRRVFRTFRYAINQRKIIFIHVPKSAGSSISHLLYNNINIGHHKAINIARWLPEEFALYPSFSVVRNPYDRVESAYYYLKTGGNNKVDLDFSKRVLSRYRTLSEFVVKGLGDPLVLGWIHFIPQYKFICDEDGSQLVDVVEKLEALTKSSTLLDIGVDLGALRFINQGPRRGRGLSSTEKDLVFDVYRKDFEIFGYER